VSRSTRIPADDAYRQRLLGLLGGTDAVTSMERTAARVAEVARSLGPEAVRRPWAPGKWTGSQILSHLADVELAVGFRLRQALAEPDHQIQPFDQDAWARRYGALDTRLALEAFLAARAWNLALVRSLSGEDLARVAVHPERGPETVAVIVRMLAGHDLNHLHQLEALAAAI
jgi:hypothetical protein